MQKQCPTEENKEMCMSLFKMFGDRWSLRIIDTLRDGERRFKEIETDLNINSATLSSRLRSLQKAKLIVRREETIDGLSVTYILTDLGRELLPIYDGIMSFGKKFSR